MANAPQPLYLGPAAHTSGAGNKPIHRIVIHCTVSPCKEGGARTIAKYFRNPRSGGSAHYVVDPGETVQVVYDSVIAWHAPPNSHSLGIELCDPMTGSDNRWDDANHEAMLVRAAELVAKLCLAYDVPITRLSVSELKAGQEGICGHVDVSAAFRQSSHWDPGPAFPWKHFMALVRAAAADNYDAPTATKKAAAKPAKKPAKTKPKDTDMKPEDLAGAPISMLVGDKNTPTDKTLQQVLRDLEGTQDAQGKTQRAMAAQLHRIEKLLEAAIASGKS